MVERPRRPGLLLDDLVSGSEDDLVLERSHDGVVFTDVDLTGERLHDRQLIDCRLVRGRLDDTVLTGARLRGSRLEACEGTAVRLDQAELHEVEIDSSRLGALDAYDGQWRVVHLKGCRVGYLNLRGSRLTDVTFEGCTLTDLDLGGAEVSRMTFVDTRVDSLLLQDASLADVDLRGAGLEQISSLEALRGATVSPEQLQELAPLLAAHLGLEIG